MADGGPLESATVYYYYDRKVLTEDDSESRGCVENGGRFKRED